MHQLESKALPHQALETGDSKALLKAIRSFLSDLNAKEELPLSQQAYLATRHAICELLLLPEQTVLERELSDLLEMSRTPVREALIRLETEGWIQIIPRRGFIVAAIAPDDFRQTFEVLQALDELAVTLATQHIMSHQLNQLDHLIKEQEVALEMDHLLKWTNLDREFHQLIIDAANNQHLKEVRDIQSDMIYRASLYTIKARIKPTHSILEHKAIVAAMRTQEPEAARTMLKSHQARAGKEMLKTLETITSQL